MKSLSEQKKDCITEASKQQRKATDPSLSVWVEASAGTGKTKVLSDRVLRLLLNDTDPTKILCLTYTKAAAVE
ncbi:MAG: UvrD-helicase domain-containing protein, partial [Alphaproteobacteria bacterium]|nr:UvrD-helicase domain-containing protein [Alphaproteobacteria bacterium]